MKKWAWISANMMNGRILKQIKFVHIHRDANKGLGFYKRMF
jgi:hypothetical protein